MAAYTTIIYWYFWFEYTYCLPFPSRYLIAFMHSIFEIISLITSIETKIYT